MPTFTVTKVSPETTEFSNANGTFLTYKLKGHLDGGPEEVVSINTKKDAPKVPTPGEVIPCEVVREHPQYGKTIKRVSPPPGVTPATSRGSNNPDSIYRSVAAKEAATLVAAQLTSGQLKVVSSLSVTDAVKTYYEFLYGLMTGQLEKEPAPLPDPAQEALDVFSEEGF